ncbi:MAG: antitoxin family protein [Candidatus Sumerlaeia bacterium]|nr:antitoxin family protein [Candidatus Sumerlaeia bacterium]
MTIQAVYENGVFRPVEPVDLPEHTPVMVETIMMEIPQQRTKMTIGDLARFQGTMEPWPEDPTVWQQKTRDEEWN